MTTCLALATPVLLLTAIGQWERDSVTLFYCHRSSNKTNPGLVQSPNPDEVKPLLKETTSPEGTLAGAELQSL